MRVDIEEILKAQEVLNKVNRIEFKEIEFYQNGEPIQISKKVLDDWEFIGLTNTDFIITEFYSLGDLT